jgi:hypothetical protein
MWSQIGRSRLAETGQWQRRSENEKLELCRSGKQVATTAWRIAARDRCSFNRDIVLGRAEGAAQQRPLRGGGWLRAAEARLDQPGYPRIEFVTGRRAAGGQADSNSRSAGEFAGRRVRPATS